MWRPVLAGLILARITIQFASAQENAAPASLIQYVRNAKKSGLSDTEIQASARKAGWKAADVEHAIGATEAKAKEPEAPAATAQPDPNSGAAGDYQIGAGDVVQVSVWKEPDASISNTVVRTDGKISLPLVKEFEIAGLTTAQAEKRIAGQLSKFITAPDVTVIVSAINSKKVFVNGAVKKEGPIPLTYRMTVLQALSEAGGLTDYAKRKKIYVLHFENGREFKLDFDYDAVLKGLKLEQNILLSPGDTVVVPH